MLTLFRLAMEEGSPVSPSDRLPIPESATSTCRLATGRSALFHLIQRLPKPHASTVLLPCYVAEGVIQPFLNAGFTILFYRLQANLSPVIEDVASLFERVNGKAVFILIHYFGFSARSKSLSRLLSQHEPVVVEDCAHAPFTTMPDGRAMCEDGELTLYSLNKFLPVIDGAILISNRSDIDLSLDECVLPELPEDTQKAYLQHLQTGRALFECDEPIAAKKILIELGASYERYYATINSSLTPCRQSISSRRLESSFSIKRLCQQRVINSRILYEEFSSRTLSLVFPELPSGVVPFCVPARAPANRRPEIINKMLDCGILLSTLRDKWDFVPPDRRAHFSTETAFLDEHVLIPISEFIPASAVRRMVKQLNRI